MNAPADLQHATLDIPLDAIAPSPTNPRKRFDGDSLNELAENIKKLGVMQPILVRAHPEFATEQEWMQKNATNQRGPMLPVEYEIVFGERRWRAAKLAGRQTIPAMVRELDDAEVLEIQVIENLQRENVHELEEAEGFEQLMKRHGYTAEQLAAKTGKSKAYIYARLKLCALCPEAREMFYAGKLHASTALLVARIPVPDLQIQAAQEIAEPQYGEPLSYRRAADLVQNRYMLQLDEAEFDCASADLLPTAGPCTTCPKRTGNQPELFGDVDSADVCTDPACYQAKQAAHWAAVRAKHERAGHTVISGEHAQKLMPYGVLTLREYVALDSRCYEDGAQRTYREIIGRAPKCVVLIENARDGSYIEAIPESQADKLTKGKLQEAKEDDTEAGRSHRQFEEKCRAEARERVLQKNIREATFRAARNAWPSTLRRTELALIAQGLWLLSDDQEEIAALWGWQLTEEDDNPALDLDALGAEELTRLIYDLTFAPMLSQWCPYPQLLDGAVAHLGIDTAQIRADAEAELAGTEGDDE